MQALYSWFWRLIPGNPQIVRIVQGGSRRLPHALVRTGYLGVLILIVVTGMLSGGALSGDVVALNDLAKAGSQVFRVVAYGQVVLVCLIAPVFMAGAIASEQSGKTYNILLTTPLSNLQIVLGSLLGRLFFIGVLLLSGLPLFAVMLVFGGVPVSSIFLAFAVAGLTALFVGSVAVVLSVMRAGGRKAVFVFVIAIAAYLVVVGALDMVLLRQFVPGQTTVLTSIHPLLVLEATINRAEYAPPSAEFVAHHAAPIRLYLSNPFASFSILTAGSSLLMILFCSLWVRKVGNGDSKLVTKIKSKLRMGEAGEGGHRSARSLGNGNPIAWREANTRGKLAAGIIARYGFVALGLFGLGLLMYFYHTSAYWENVPALDALSTGAIDPHPAKVWFRAALSALLIAEVAVIALVAIYMAAGSVSREREDGTLDIMLTTPITPRYYIWGKLRGLVRFLSVLISLPIITLAIVALYSVVGTVLGWDQASVAVEIYNNQGYYNSYGGSSAPQSTYVATELINFESPLMLALMLVPFVSLCVAIGMFWSLKAKGVLGAVVPAVAIIGLGSIVLGLCGLAAAGSIVGVGPVLNAFSPSTNILMLVDPYENVSAYSDSPAMGRLSIFIGALAVCGGYATIVWAMIAAMVRGFDHTVRKLSGAK